MLPRLAIILGLFAAALSWGGDRPMPDAKPGLRRPVALALAPAGDWLFVANRAGTISVLDTKAGKPGPEIEAGRRLADLAASTDGRRLVAVDEAANELVVLEVDAPRLKVAHRIRVASRPVCVRLSADGGRCFVASLWARRLSVIDLTAEPPRVARTIELPFAPRLVLPVREPAKLIAADAFGGRLAVVDPAEGKVESVRELPVHNIRGLALAGDGQELWLTGQTLSPLAETSRDDIHWGNLITNHLRQLKLAEVLRPDGDPLRGSLTVLLGSAGRGAGDPAGFAVTANGKAVIALAGVDEIILDPRAPEADRRVSVGKRPTGLALGGQRAYVANTFSDSISVVDLAAGKVEAEIALGPAAERTPVDRGEELFHSARLSHQGWMSCHSCHTDGHSNSRLADTQSDGTYGTPKRVLSLLGVRDSAPYAWNGSMPDLATQVRQSIAKTMNGPAPKDDQVAALVAYLESLETPPALALFDAKLDLDAVKRGAGVFARQACDRCHTPPAYTSSKKYDVGLMDEAGARQFNPPSLRGVSQGGPYFHDGRAATLEEVFARYRHQLQGKLAEDELRDLLAFLRSL